jgi:LPLT family lysophospholipid transporter-like MFS transporter
MAVFIIVLSFSGEIWSARMILFIIGMAGGMFIVPINAALQELGQQSIGSGSAVAMQGFFQNVAMLLAVGLYTLSTAQDVSPVMAMLILGILLLIAALAVSLRLPKDLSDTNP